MLGALLLQLPAQLWDTRGPVPAGVSVPPAAVLKPELSPIPSPPVLLPPKGTHEPASLPAQKPLLAPRVEDIKLLLVSGFRQTSNRGCCGLVNSSRQLWAKQGRHQGCTTTNTQPTAPPAPPWAGLVECFPSTEITEV